MYKKLSCEYLIENKFFFSVYMVKITLNFWSQTDEKLGRILRHEYGKGIKIVKFGQFGVSH